MNAIPCPAHLSAFKTAQSIHRRAALIRVQADALMSHSIVLETYHRACRASENHYGAESWRKLAHHAREEAELLYTRANILESYIK
ncbi:hypothetical protein [Acetobacter pasteurianus]|uniref:hypothetical protein n=1 Tax=Acetobacter pasteurianus TaxID=438 RepID=UPI00030E0AFE|nr:hypothetical protein [Acetobacter pasteurianus]